MPRIALTALLFALAVSPAAAHEHWLSSTTARAGVGAPVALGARVGEDLSGEALPFRRTRGVRFELHAAERRDLLAIATEGDTVWARVSATDAHGMLVVWQSDFLGHRMPGREFDAYLEAEGLDGPLAARRAAGAASDGRERYRRCSKRWLAGSLTSATGRTRATQVLGLPLELVPDEAPGADGVLDVRLLAEGAPVAGVLVQAWHAASAVAGQRVWRGRSDTEGRVRVPCAGAGEWLISAVHMVPCTSDPSADWESTWASLAFTLPGGSRDADTRAGQVRREPPPPGPRRLVEDAIADTLEVIEVHDSFDHAVGRLRSASEGLVGQARLALRPARRAAEVLEVVPGAVISQHSGEGKANQYYLRGFNLDHGTDVALSVGGVPVNMPTHAHGQGYADLSFVIPELVSAVQYRKGTPYADEGDFAAAGAVHMTYRNTLERPLAELEVEDARHRRGLLAGSRPAGSGHLLAALEALDQDGPWVHPSRHRRWNGVLRWSRQTPAGGHSLTAMGYDARWNATDQVPLRAVEGGALDRFGTVDPTDGGRSHRYSLSSEWARAEHGATTRASVFALAYRLRLWSNFTYFLDDTVRGDQFEQAEDRVAVGLRAMRVQRGRWAGREVEWTTGVQARHDRIADLGLHATRARVRHATTREDDVAQTSIAPHAQVSMQAAPWLRAVAGMRLDAYAFAVRSDRAANSGRCLAAQLSPKGAVVLGPWKRTAVFLDAGFGFHSNDARGTTLREDPATGGAASPVDPLVRALGLEAGLRSSPWPGVQTTVALWQLALDSELLFVGDAGTTDATRPSRRVGVEWSLVVDGPAGLMLDGDLALTRARFRDRSPEGDRIPGALERVAAAGVTWKRSDALAASFRVRHLGPRSLTERGDVRSRASTLLSGLVAWRGARGLGVVLEGLNLAGSRSSDIDYFYTSRLPGEPAGGVEDIHTHPVEPRTVRVRIGRAW